MNQIDSAILGTLGEVVSTFEQAAEDAPMDVWMQLLMLAAPYKAALISAAYHKGYPQMIQYLRAAEAKQEGKGLDDLTGATKTFADMVEEAAEGKSNALGNVRMYGMVLRGAASQTVQMIKAA